MLHIMTLAKSRCHGEIAQRKHLALFRLVTSRAHHDEHWSSCRIARFSMGSYVHIVVVLSCPHCLVTAPPLQSVSSACPAPSYASAHVACAYSCRYLCSPCHVAPCTDRRLPCLDDVPLSELVCRLGPLSSSIGSVKVKTCGAIFTWKPTRNSSCLVIRTLRYISLFLALLIYYLSHTSKFRAL